MEEHLSAMIGSQERYVDAIITLLKEYQSAGGLPIEEDDFADDLAVDLANENLKEEAKLLALTNKDAMAFFEKRIQQVRELQAELQANAMDPNAPKPDHAQIKLRLLKLINGKEDLESEAQFGDAANVSEEHDMAASEDFPDLDLSRLELEEAVEHEETVEHNTAASEETVEGCKKVLPVLPDPGPSNSA